MWEAGRQTDRQNREEGEVGVQSSKTLDKGVKPLVVWFDKVPVWINFIVDTSEVTKDQVRSRIAHLQVLDGD